ncbi:MAG: prepilin-type N-terminal cleavage/methylation domain-containing protein [Candidatus Sumerlaeaceae bacterium]|jgi:prepilin-type N-terminal cleavage/methylation domain-containing protein
MLLGTKQWSRGLTLIEVVIVLAIIAIIVAIAAPTWLRQRENARGIACQENLVKISQAKEQYAMEFRLSNGGTLVYPDDLVSPPGTTGSNQGFLKVVPRCPADGIYAANPIGVDPTCSIGSSVAPYVPHIIPH